MTTAEKKAAKQQLIESEPLMNCATAAEFKQRLQWLSEGMLRIHLESVWPYVIDQSEIEHYRRYRQKVPK